MIYHVLVEKPVDLSPRRPKGPTHQKARKLIQTLYLSSIDCHLLIIRSVKETRTFRDPDFLRHPESLGIGNCGPKLRGKSAAVVAEAHPVTSSRRRDSMMPVVLKQRLIEESTSRE